MNVLIIAAHKYGEQPAAVVIERREDHLWTGFIPAQGNQPVSIQKRHIAYLGDQPVVHENNIQIERH